MKLPVDSKAPETTTASHALDKVPDHRLDITIENSSTTSKSISTVSKAVDEPKSNSQVERVSWLMTSVLLMADVMGTGVLSLPYAAARIGWVLAMFALVLFAYAAAYSGELLAAVRNEHFPGVNSYADVAVLTGGRRFGIFTQAAILINWGMLMPYFLISIGDSLELIFYDAGLCQTKKTLIAVALLALPIQCRDFHAISFLSVPSTLAIVIAITCVLATMESPDDVQTSVGPPAGQDFLSLYSSFSSFIFAYQGQSIFLELMREMRDSRQFPKSTTLAYSIMMVVYGITVVTAYSVQGDMVASFLPANMDDGWLKRFVGVLLTFHVLIAYVVTGQPFNRFFHSKLFPATLDGGGAKARLHWAFISLSYLAFGFLLANAIPFFAAMQELVGSLCGAPIIFGWPAFFYASACRRKVSSWREVPAVMGIKHTVLCALFLFVFLPLFTILGTIGAVEDIIDAVRDSPSPFAC